MKTQISLFLILIIAFCGISCNKIPSDNQITLITIENNKKPVKNTLDAFTIDRVIQLDSTRESYFRYMESITIKDDTIYVFGDKHVKSFDINGKYINSIGHIGLGPHEVSSISSYSILNNKFNITLWDNKRSSIVFFTSNGTYIKEHDISINYVYRVYSISDKDYLLFTYLPQEKGSKYCLYKHNIDNNKTQGLLKMPNDPKTLTIQDHNNISTYKDNIYIRFPLNNIIYKYDPMNSNLFPIYKINFRNGNIYNSKIQQKCNTLPELLYMIKENNIITLRSFNEFSDNYVVSYSQNSIIYTQVIDKHTGNQSLLESINSKDILSNCLAFTKYKDFLIGVIDPITLKKAYNRCTDRSQKDILNKSFDAINIEEIPIYSNIILVFFKINTKT